MTSGAAPRALPQMVPAMVTGSGAAMRSRTPQRGFTYLGVMFLVFFIGIGLSKAGTAWQTEVQREKERELLFVGEQFRQAITSYYENTPEGVKQYPPTLEALLHDPRFPQARRHLRRIYPDPVTGSAEWGLVKEKGRIVGVYSKSETQPLRKVFTDEGRQGFSDAESYTGWIFAYHWNGEVTAPGALPSGTDISAAAPVAASAEPVNQSGISPASEPPPANSSDNSCAGLTASDFVICREACKRAPGACAGCYDSLRERRLACAQNRIPPPLVTK